jgi:hypothetical protein
MDGILQKTEAIPSRPAAARVTATTVPWSEWCLAIAAASIAVGVIWDISWHVSIGRDSFWTAAHMVIYFGGTLGGCVGGWLAIQNTFLANPEQRAAAVRILGARAPLGAWVAIWGAVAMLTSAPFDNWWHNAYGLDVKIISPPHVLLGLGMLGICVGALLLAVARQNREPEGAGGAIFIFTGGIFVVLGGVFITEFSYPNFQHAAAFYSVAGGMFAFRLITVGRAGRVAWPATKAALVYICVDCLMTWILPLFPAQPRLAPIFNPVTHMVPPAFPLLLVFPAIGLDMYLRHGCENDSGGWQRVLHALALGAIFLVIFLPVQWLCADFMLSPHADNWFFAGNRTWGYGAEPGAWRREFWDVNEGFGQPTVRTAIALLHNLFWTGLSAWFGLVWGGWMRKVRR